MRLAGIRQNGTAFSITHLVSYCKRPQYRMKDGLVCKIGMLEKCQRDNKDDADIAFTEYF